jgi:hypothetical protein
MPDFTAGELRHSSGGNVYELLGWCRSHCTVRRVAVIGKNAGQGLWDQDVRYRWTLWQWESLPLVGEKSDDPSFGVFLPRSFANG